MKADNAVGIVDLAIIATIVFVILKLSGAIAWSWLWVLSPLWIVAGLIVAAVAITVAVVAFIKAVEK